MADKQTGTGARGKQNKPKGQQSSERGNDTRSSMDNRSKQIKDFNRSNDKTERGNAAGR